MYLTSHIPEQKEKFAHGFAMSDLSQILVLQIKICIKPDLHGKDSKII